MSFYAGPDLVSGSVSIGGVDPEEMRRCCAASDMSEDFGSCLSSAESRDDVLYFSIRTSGNIAGQILLHDIASDGSGALVAYHLLYPAARNAGVATAALGLLAGHVARTGIVRTMSILSESGNIASQRVAEKNGFESRGASPEGTGLCLHVWKSPSVAGLPLNEGGR